ncbi:MAG: hypothetical protein A2Z04_08880 [Chloroflexi bacterium RBG_16_57_9]|nr:MAG: hypothetical protein A2Z04_08880 [Chloroflexi bacterium RBG_16_57_9]
MSVQVTLTLPDKLRERAQRWANLTHRELPEALTDMLEIVLTPAHTAPNLDKPISAMLDHEVLALSRLQMPHEQGQQMGELLVKQREGELEESERPELLALMQVYERLWIRQSEALAEAVRRGLREPLEP